MSSTMRWRSASGRGNWNCILQCIIFWQEVQHTQKDRLDKGHRLNLEKAFEGLEKPESEELSKEDKQKQSILCKAPASSIFSTGEARGWMKNMYREPGLAGSAEDRCAELASAGLLVETNLEKRKSGKQLTRYRKMARCELGEDGDQERKRLKVPITNFA